MRIIDAHVHVLESYPPMAPFDDLGRPDRMLYLMDECKVEMALLVPVVADFSQDNNAECGELARAHPDRFSALTDVQLHLPEAADQISNARETYGAVGISYYPSSGDVKWMLESNCESVWNALESQDLVCSLQMPPPTYPVLLELARRYPKVKFQSNHLALPSSLDERDDTYGGFVEAGNLQNLSVKASGFYAAAKTPWDFRCARVLALFKRLLEIVGPERLLWGSDWPPSGRHLTYLQHLEHIRTFASLKEPDLAKVLGENAARIYGI
jgi:L-fuconolactonase